MAFPTSEFLNDPAEWHALGAGFFRRWVASCGRAPRDPRSDVPEPPEKHEAEAHYWKAGYVAGDIAGTLTQIIVVAVGVTQVQM
jgi:hypothetical protein